MVNPERPQAARDLDIYFHGAGTNRELNIGLAQNVIEKWGNDTSVVGALYWIVDDLQTSTQAFRVAMSLKRNSFGPSVLDVIRYNKSKALMEMNQMFDFIHAIRVDSGPILTNWVQKTSDEDVRALGSFMLATDQFPDLKAQTLLLDTYYATEGTSCRLALEAALYRQGIQGFLQKSLNRGYFYSIESYDALKGFTKEAYPSLAGDKLEEKIIDIALFPETYGPNLSPIPGLLGILSADIGTKGELHPPIEPWVRKQYND